MNGAGCFQCLAAGTDIEIALLLISEFSTGELALRRHSTPIPDRDMRIDVPRDQPTGHLARAIGHIAGQSRRQAAPDHLLEHLAQDIARAETAATVDREGRMIRDRMFKAQTAKPSMRRATNPGPEPR